MSHPANDSKAGEQLAACWSCTAQMPAAEPFCPDCGAIQPPRTEDHFARLGLAAGYRLDPAELDRRYFALQQQFHPDRFAARSPRERTLSLQHATSLNEAYRILKAPLSRAEYLLQLAGRAPRSDGAETTQDPELLMEAMELREELAEAGPGEAAGLAARVRSQVAEIEDGLAGTFAAGDLEQAFRDTQRLRYLNKLLDEARLRRAGGV